MDNSSLANNLLWVAICLLAAIALISLICLKKIRSIHLASFDIRQRLQNTETEVGALFSQIQSLMALERQLALPQALPPMRGWAGSPDFLLKVAQQALRQKPESMIECSSGVSTVVLARCAQLAGKGHVYSLEHEAEYAEKTRNLLKNFGLDSFATVLHAPLVDRSGHSPWYDESVLPHDMAPAGMLVIDGPPAGLARQARYPAIPRLLSKLAPSVTVMLDDAGREDELEIVRRWTAEVTAFKSEYLPLEKGLAILTRQG